MAKVICPFMLLANYTCHVAVKDYIYRFSWKHRVSRDILFFRWHAEINLLGLCEVCINLSHCLEINCLLGLSHRGVYKFITFYVTSFILNLSF